MAHFCWVCMEEKPNEKFSGKGRRRGICKSCRKLGPAFINEMKESQRRVQHYNNTVKSGNIFGIEEAYFYVFTYMGPTYVAAGEHLDVVFHYSKKEEEFMISEELSGNWEVSDALLNGYYNLMENCHYVDYGALEEQGPSVLTKRQKRFVAVYQAIYQKLYIEGM